MKCGMPYSLRESSAAWKTKKRQTYAWLIAIILTSLKAEPHKTYIEIASAGNCRNNYSKKKKLIWLQTRLEPAEKTSGTLLLLTDVAR